MTRSGEVQDSKTGPTVFVAGMWRRIAAALIDIVCLSPVLLLAGWLAFHVAEIPFSLGKSLRPELILELALWGGLPFYGVLVMAIALSLLYAFLFVSTTGSTPGLWLLRVHVINVYGDRPEWWRVLIRCWGMLLGLATFGLGVLWIGFDREKRGLHDLLAGTYVIRRGSPAA